MPRRIAPPRTIENQHLSETILVEEQDVRAPSLISQQRVFRLDRADFLILTQTVSWWEQARGGFLLLTLPGIYGVATKVLTHFITAGNLESILSGKTLIVQPADWAIVLVPLLIAGVFHIALLCAPSPRKELVGRMKKHFAENRPFFETDDT